MLGLAGCSGGTNRGSGEIVLAHPASTEMTRLYADAADAFERDHPGKQVRPLPITGSDYYGKLLVLMAAQESPDVVWMGQGFGEFADRGVFLDLEARVRADPSLDASEMPAEVLNWYRANGRLSGLPFGLDLNFIVYNQDLFDAAREPYPRWDWTLEQFLATARRLTHDRDGDGKAEVWGYRGGMEPFSFGAHLLTADHTAPDVASPEMIRYLRFSLDLMYRWKVSPPIAASDLEEQESMVDFQSGRVAMLHGHSWLLPDLRKRMAGRRWEICPPPGVNGRAHWASSQGFCISRDTRDPETSWQLLRYLVTSDALWPLADHVAPVKKALRTRMLREFGISRPDLRVLSEAVDHLNADPRVPNLTELRSRLSDAVERVIQRRAEPEAAMRVASREIAEVLARRH